MGLFYQRNPQFFRSSFLKENDLSLDWTTTMTTHQGDTPTIVWSRDSTIRVHVGGKSVEASGSAYVRSARRLTPRAFGIYGGKASARVRRRPAELAVPRLLSGVRPARFAALL